ncbi:hypothetical protein [Amycolatopsis kentuckyensis]|uniref:hypothetical protein n=1 Tax=Amycolatopsis kentuckyensis TaxID=218823 RepID=UPI001302295D|nr:hypothetical protein [Amycolatopsis kentuckyensis]
MKRVVRALVRALTGIGWVLVLPVPPFEPGLAVPVPRPGPTSCWCSFPGGPEVVSR